MKVGEILNKKVFTIKPIKLTFGRLIEIIVLLFVIYTFIGAFLACGSDPTSLACVVKGREAGLWIIIFVVGEITFRGMHFLYKLIHEHR